MSDEGTTSSPKPSTAGAKGGGNGVGSAKLIIGLLLIAVVFAGGGAFYHYASQNAGRYFVELRGDVVVVRKGIFFPQGAADFEEGGAAYRPIQVTKGTRLAKQVLPDLVSVDRVLYPLLMDLAKGAIESEDAGRITSAKELLRRARLLGNISEEEADEILRYKGDIALAEGHMALREVRGLLERALERVARAKTRGTRLYKDPAGWERWIQSKLAEFQALEGAKEPPEIGAAPPAFVPTPAPEPAPSLLPDAVDDSAPTEEPPAEAPADTPTDAPADAPADAPTTAPTAAPADAPTVAPAPAAEPSTAQPETGAAPGSLLNDLLGGQAPSEEAPAAPDAPTTDGKVRL